MSDYEKQFQATAKYSDSEPPKIEQNGGEDLSSVVPGSDRHLVEWADVLRDLRDNGEAYY